MSALTCSLDVGRWCRGPWPSACPLGFRVRCGVPAALAGALVAAVSQLCGRCPLCVILMSRAPFALTGEAAGVQRGCLPAGVCALCAGRVRRVEGRHCAGGCREYNPVLPSSPRALTAWMPSSALAEQSETAPEAASSSCSVFYQYGHMTAGAEPRVLQLD